LAHPEGGTQSYVAPFTLDERLAHIKTAYNELGNTIPWLCDSMENDLKHALGDRPNSEFVLDPKGKIVAMRDWSNPESLRADLAKWVGPSKTVTRPSDLNLKIDTSIRPAKSGVVQRPTIPSGMRPLKVQPQQSDQPYYVKLRIEAEPAVLRGKAGKVYLGFHLDPIFDVHWNNLAAPVTYEITRLEEGEISPAQGEGPKVKVESDVDPREFILDAKNLSAGTFQVQVNYFACNDEEGWCKPVRQRYIVTLETDRDGGNAKRSGSPRGPAQRANRPETNGSPRPGGRMQGLTTERLFRNDKNQDGKISSAEMPSSMARLFTRIDTNEDGSIDRSEAEQFVKRRSPNNR